MKKIYILLSAALISGGVLSAQQVSTAANVEVAPGINGGNQNPTPQTPWQVLFSYDITAAGSGTGNAGVVQHGTELWVSRWASDTMFTYSLAGTLTSSFTIPSVSAVRSMTTDGTYIYAGNNATNIYKIDPVTKTLVSTIAVSGVPNIRYCTYDATADGGNGGFWVGTWATDWTLVDMSGQPISFVAAASHALSASYGLAVDHTSPGGPYLWAFNQTGTNNAAEFIAVNVASGTQIGVVHEVTNDMGTAGDLAGGCHIIQTPLSVVGVLQGAANLLFAYDLNGVVSSIYDNTVPADFITVCPNPTSDMLNIRVKRENNDPMTIQMTDITGKVIYQSTNVGMNNLFNMANYEAGVYFVKVEYNGIVHTAKVIRN